MAQNNEWNGQPTIFGVNTLKPHATSMPYSSIEEAKINDRRASEWYQSLAGTWKFFHVDKPADRLTSFMQDNFDATKFDDIQVPGCWQLFGYDHTIYTNVTYPWSGTDRISAPWAPTNFNPVGHYRREFTVSDKWDGKRIRLHFEGVESAFYVWINGKYVGYSENTFTDHEFDITDKLRSGKNNISVQVFRWCDGSWMEDQDFIRLAGIYRDVYLYATPKTHIQDFQINATTDDYYKDGVLNASVWVDNFTENEVSGHSVDVMLFDKEGKEVGSVLSQKVPAIKANGGEQQLTFNSTLSGANLWSGEHPYLYTLVMVLKNASGDAIQYESQRIGFRKVELKKGSDGITRYTINGSPIKMRGVNRHEMDPDHGRVISYERMVEDVKLMKKFNINGLRMSHYPNDPRMYDICDEYGIYVIDEANVESHGANRDLPASSDDWRACAVERMSSMIQRDKNHACVVLWSLGNEAGSGNVFGSERDYAHQADPTRPVHYEGDWNNADVASWMYYGEGAIYGYKDNNKPVMLCEYEHAMGNSVGELREYVDAFYANPRSFGGFIWDFIDQGLRRGDTKYFNFGGLWGDNPNDDNFCANGLVFPDRTVQPEIYEVKYQYRNILVRDKDVSKGTVTIENRFNFTNIKDVVNAVWSVMEDGKVIATGEVPASSLDIAPLSSKEVTIPFKISSAKTGSEYYLDIDFQLKETTLWADAGFSIAHDQLRIKAGEALPAQINIASVPTMTTDESNGVLNVTGKDFSIIVNLKSAVISDYTMNGMQLIKDGPVPNFWRAPTDNDKGNGMENRCGTWRYAGRDRSINSYKVNKVSANEVRIDFTVGLPKAGSSNMTMSYTIYGSGDIIVEYTLNPDGSKSEIPNIGTLFTVPGGFEKVTYYGKGPHENYIGRNQGAFMGIYKTYADSMTIPYLEIGETGQRTEVKWATLTNGNGMGLLIVGSPRMEFSAQHYTPEQLNTVKLPWDLKRDNDITLRVDLHQMGLGGINSWGAKPLDQYSLFPKQSYSHKFRISPIRGKLEDPTELANLGFKNLQTSNEVVDYPAIEYIKPERKPFNDLTIPGTIEAEDYDEGGEGIGYADNDFSNQGGEYREDGVDIVAISDGYAIGYTNDKEWLEYTVNVKSEDSFDLLANVSSGLENSSFRLFIDGEAITDTIKIPQGEDWDTYKEITSKTSTITEGNHVLRIAITGSFVNIDWIKFIGKTTSNIEIENVTGWAPIGPYMVFNLLGEAKGMIEINSGDNLNNVLGTKIHVDGVYILKSMLDNKSYMINYRK